jgi:hypothetical protein
MIRWADRQWCWIEEGEYFNNKSLDKWIALKFNPGDSTTLYSSAEKGISILKCWAPTSAHLEDLRHQEEIWDATKGNATYVKVIRQAKSKDVSPPVHDFWEAAVQCSNFLCPAVHIIWGRLLPLPDHVADPPNSEPPFLHAEQAGVHPGGVSPDHVGDHCGYAVILR